MITQTEDNSSLLIVDDEPAQVEMVQEYLKLYGFVQVDSASSLEMLSKKLDEKDYDFIMLDYRLPDGSGLDALELVKLRGLQVPVVMVTGQGDERVAAQAIQRGAIDYVIKTPNYLSSLPGLIRKTVSNYRLHAEVERSLEQIRYQATLLNNVRDAIVVWGMDGKITYWNPAANVLFGWSQDERLGCAVDEVYLNAFNPPIQPPRPGETSGQYIERQIRTKHQKTIWVSSRVAALHEWGPSSRLIGYMDVSHDITKSKEAENILRAERNFVSAVLDTVGALVVVLDKMGRIVRFNRACEQVTGFTFSEVRGRTVWDLFIPVEEQARYKEHFGHLHAGEYPSQFENSWLTRLGERRIIDWSNTVLTNRQGLVDFVIATGIDITERKMAEQARNQAFAATRAAQTQLVQAARLATIGEMASGVAHRINNPLTTILADAQILLRQLAADHPGRESAEAIEQAGWRLQQVVQQLTEFSRPASASLEPFKVNTSIQQAISLIGAHVQAAGVRLETRLAEGLPPVYGSQRQLEDLWVNLILLARDAAQEAHEEGWIQILSMPGPDGGVLVEVHDNGRPIPQEQLTTIFEPNFIGPSSNRGTGMELSICREIVRQHGGKIFVASSTGRDTIFSVILPAGERIQNGSEK